MNDARGQPRCAISVPHLPVYGASRRTYNKERRRRWGEENVSCGTTSVTIARFAGRGGWGGREGVGGGGDVGQGDCTSMLCSYINRTPPVQQTV